MFGKAGIAGLMKQAQQMQEKMKEAQANLANVEVDGESGAGLVKVTMNCHYAVKRIAIDDALIADAKDDKEMLEDLVAAAINDAVRKAEAKTQETMGQFTSGMNLPAGMGDLFK
ncbi:YbaB/EbfC family nucleoid-associated protein [Neisseria sp. Ec49-e6-T10]|uniref:YbaB/EbfC family nucleoid-associated protein n=1 Tax=Neisseria sp. Ec49-e6-T10 TaxID=3140744 RepID=UPI003EC06461